MRTGVDMGLFLFRDTLSMVLLRRFVRLRLRARSRSLRPSKANHSFIFKRSMWGNIVLHRPGRLDKLFDLQPSQNI